MNMIKFSMLLHFLSFTLKKSLFIVKLRFFQNSSFEIKQISFVYQQIRFTVKKNSSVKCKTKTVLPINDFF